MNNAKGFSLIELMIVVAVIGIVGAIAMPSYDNYMLKSRRAEAKAGLAEVADRQERYYLQASEYTDDFGANFLNISNETEEGYYIITVALSSSNQSYTLTATAQGSQVNDTTTGAGDCTVMTLNSVGLKTAPNAEDPLGDDLGGTEVIPDCW